MPFDVGLNYSSDQGIPTFAVLQKFVKKKLTVTANGYQNDFDSFHILTSSAKLLRDA